MQLSGFLPENMGNIPLQQIQIDGNALTGPLPASLANLNNTLTDFDIADNYLEGNLKAVAGISLVRVTVHNNPGLCGMVRPSVSFCL